MELLGLCFYRCTVGFPSPSFLLPSPFLQELKELESSLKGLANLTGMKASAEQALALFNGRLSMNFSYEMLSCLRFLDPTVNQKMTFTQLEREGLVHKVIQYAGAMFRRREMPVTELDLVQGIGEFVGRTGVFQ